MKRRIQAIVMAAIMLTALLVMPSTYAKYTLTKSYDIGVTANTLFRNTSNGSAITVNLPYKGRYLIIAKGGDGADGRKNNGDDYSDPSVPGGIGGTVMGVYTATNTTTSLYLCPGTAGELSGGRRNPGDGGKNTGANGYSGGKGSYVKDTGTLSSSTSGCGGGAASVVFLGANNSGTKLLIAGGGGAGGCYNVQWRSIGVVDAKAGGNGGSMSSTHNNLADGVEYDGYDGQGDNFSYWGTKYSTSGKAGKTSGGVGGSINRQFAIIDPGNGKSGSSNGDGGEAYQYGGGGGAGYCGGGGGASSSINYAAGGGGGGSSFVSSTLTALSDADMNLADTMISIAKTSTSSRSAIPTQYTDCSGNGDGYIIVMYLGE